MTNTLQNKSENRPAFPRRAVVTGGMPYGNKALHLGHVGGVFIHADVFARFLRDRIGGDHVIFVSGTDCYGSPITENYRALCESGQFSGSIEDFVTGNHEDQKEVLKQFEISLDLFAASGLGRAAEIHRELSAEVIQTLYQNGHLEKRVTQQFYDPVREMFLNGRQVAGRCPIAGCKSDKAYADECSLGHQYDPRDLIAPKSALTGETPEMREVQNWYLKLDGFQTLLKDWLEEYKTRPESREFLVKSIGEFLEPPVIYLKREYLDALTAIQDSLPSYELRDDGKAPSAALLFDTLSDRETACARLTAENLRYRTGKTLVPFRLTGNIEWGVPAPALDGLDGLTFWVWPESLWAPISFSKAVLENREKDSSAWRDYWASDEAKVYQFIGQDNIYFYGPAETALFMGLSGKEPTARPAGDSLRFPSLMANNHVLFLDKKASSSGNIKPPTARELLKHYTAEQLRAHFMGLGLSLRSVSFQPKPFNPAAKPDDADPVLKEGNLLIGVMNRIARSCFYTAQKYTDGKIPQTPPSEDAMETAALAALDYEALMARGEFHGVMNLLDDYIRGINKTWSKSMKDADAGDNTQKRLAVLADCFHMMRVATVLLHPIAPSSTERLAGYMNMAPNFFDWQDIFRPVQDFIENPETHRLKFLEPRVDFFERHPSQTEA